MSAPAPEDVPRPASTEPAAAAEEEADYDEETLKAQAEQHVHSTEEKDAILHIDANEEIIELNSLRIFSMEEVDLSTLTKCTTLEMRKNLIHKMMPLPRDMRDRLDTLDLFDNKIRHIGPYLSHCDSPAFSASKLVHTRLDLLAANGGNGCAFACLRKLDLSYNQITEIAGLDDLAPTLEELYLVENKLKKIGDGLAKLTRLKLLELGGNQIRDVTTGLETLVNLEQLWLGKNKINKIGTGLVTLRKLQRLSLQANRLVSIGPEVFPEGAHPELNELYLSENGLKHIEHVGHLKSLVLLDYSFNPISTLYLPPAIPATDDASSGDAQQADATSAVPSKQTALLPTCFPELEEFWLTDGEIDSWEEVETIFKPFADSLRTVYLERNPIERDKRYRSKIVLALPFVTQIDSWPVVNRDDPDTDRAIRR